MNDEGILSIKLYENTIAILEKLKNVKLGRAKKRIDKEIGKLEKEILKIKDSEINTVTLDSEVNYDAMLKVAEGIYQTKEEASAAVGILKERLREGKIITNSDMVGKYNRQGGSGSDNITEMNLQRLTEGYMSRIK